jgi:hypothetical protein
VRSGHHLSTEVDLNGVDPDDDEVGLCGTTEISTMIRELEFSTKKGSATTSAAKTTGTSSSSTTPTTAAPAANNISRHSGSGSDGELSPQAVIDQVGGQPSLRRVLKAYSLYDREWILSRMNFIAMFLTLMSKESLAACWYVDNIVFRCCQLPVAVLNCVVLPSYFTVVTVVALSCW